MCWLRYDLTTQHAVHMDQINRKQIIMSIKTNRRSFLRRTLLSSLLSLQVIFGYAQLHDRSLKVMTYNIHHANPPSKPDVIDMQAIAHVINNYQPDLVALQEVDVNNRRSGESLDQAAELGKLTGMEHFFVKGIDYEGGAYGIAVLSRLPILNADSLRLPMEQNSGGEPRVMAIITVETESGDSLLFACTHLDLKEENRMLQANAITAHFNKRLLPVIIGGDFNAKPGSDVINHFDKYFKRSSVPGKAAFTIPEKQPNREIDFIMYKSKGAFKPVKHEVVKEPYASDHLPVYVEFTY